MNDLVWPELVLHVLAHLECTAHLPSSLYDPNYVELARQHLGPAETRALVQDLSALAAMLDTHERLSQVQRLARLHSSLDSALAASTLDLASLGTSSGADLKLRDQLLRDCAVAAELLRCAALLEAEAFLRWPLPVVEPIQSRIDQAIPDFWSVSPWLRHLRVRPLRVLGHRGRAFLDEIWVGIPAQDTDASLAHGAHQTTHTPAYPSLAHGADQTTPEAHHPSPTHVCGEATHTASHPSLAHGAHQTTPDAHHPSPTHVCGEATHTASHPSLAHGAHQTTHTPAYPSLAHVLCQAAHEATVLEVVHRATIDRVNLNEREVEQVAVALLSQRARSSKVSSLHAKWLKFWAPEVQAWATGSQLSAALGEWLRQLVDTQVALNPGEGCP